MIASPGKILNRSMAAVAIREHGRTLSTHGDLRRKVATRFSSGASAEEKNVPNLQSPIDMHAGPQGRIELIIGPMFAGMYNPLATWPSMALQIFHVLLHFQASQLHSSVESERKAWPVEMSLLLNLGERHFGSSTY